MKKIFFLFLFVTNFLNAQTSWPPVGAKWVYAYSDAFGGGPTCYIRCIGDTIILGKDCSRLQYHCNSCANGAIIRFMYTDSGKVYFYDNLFSTPPKFQMLFDINSTPGNIFNIDCGNGYDSIVTKVDSVSIININGHALKKLYTHNIHHPTTLNAFGGPIIEGIGYLGFMIPWAYIGCNEYSAGPLGCYTDSILGFYDWGIIANCDVVSIEDEVLNELKIYPNPNEGEFTLEGISNTNAILFDIYGNKIKKIELENNLTEINLTYIAKGIYFLQISKKNSNIIKKIIIY